MTAMVYKKLSTISFVHWKVEPGQSGWILSIRAYDPVRKHDWRSISWTGRTKELGAIWPRKIWEGCHLELMWNPDGQ